MVRGLRVEEQKSGGGVDETYSLKDFSRVLQRKAIVANRIEGRKLGSFMGAGGGDDRGSSLPSSSRRRLCNTSVIFEQTGVFVFGRAEGVAAGIAISHRPLLGTVLGGDATLSPPAWLVCGDCVRAGDHRLCTGGREWRLRFCSFHGDNGGNGFCLAAERVHGCGLGDACVLPQKKL